MEEQEVESEIEDDGFEEATETPEAPERPEVPQREDNPVLREVRNALRRQEKRNKELAEKVARFDDLEKANQNMREGLRLFLGDQTQPQVAQPPQEDPVGEMPDPYTEPDQLAEWHKKREEHIAEVARKAAEESAKKYASEAIQSDRDREVENARLNMSTSAAKDFISRYPDLGKDTVWQRDIKPLADRMHFEKLGSGEGGTLTVEDIEGIAYRNKTHRALMQTKRRQQQDSDVLQGIREASQPVPRGTVDVSDLATKTPAEIAATLKKLGVNSAAAAALLDQLPDEVVFKLNF